MDSITPFTKVEKVSATKYKAPRMIQARDLTFNIEYGRYVKPLELRLGKRDQFGKGNFDQIGSKIARLKKTYRYATEADHKTFDAYVTKEHLKLTHKFYQSCYMHDRELRQLSKRTLKNRCKTREGDKYTVHGTRMSGDVDTSLGNSLVNYAVIMGVLEKLGLKGEAIVNGDDSIIFTHEPIDLLAASQAFSGFGFVTEMKPSVEKLEDVEFCRCKCVINNDGRCTLLMNPRRLYDIYGMTYKQLSNYQEYLLEVLVAYAIINKNTSLGKHYSDLYQRATFGKKPDFNMQFKHLDKALVRNVMKQRESQADDSRTINNSMLWAWPDAFMNFEEDMRRWRHRLQMVLSMPKINSEDLRRRGKVWAITYINHDAATVEHQYPILGYK